MRRSPVLFLIVGLAKALISPPIPRFTPGSSLFMSPNDAENMRRLLEASWSQEAMGSVPTNAKNAADAVVQSLVNAQGASSTKAFLVDILLPQYDISQGSRLYDEVSAVEFCIEVANKLSGKTQILVRDQKVVDVVSKVFDRRQHGKTPKLAKPSFESKEGTLSSESDFGDDVEFFDDFADFGAIGETSAFSVEDYTDEDSTPSADQDVDSFRSKLMESWENSTVNPEAARDAKDPPSSAKLSDAAPVPRSYRLSSMFGANKISQGPDMTDDVVKALKANGLPSDDEDTVIILSSISNEEMVAIRALMSNYKRKKTFVFVNCRLDPLPRELIDSETVYSILPLIARPATSGTNIFGNSGDDSVSSKVVVMRRYPRDWEIFVDVGRGFESASTLSTAQVGRRGPSMEVVSATVKKFLQARME